MTQEEFPTHREEDAARYSKFRWWLGMTLGDMFDKTTDLYPNKEAVIDDTGRLSYAQVREKADRLAVSLMELGIQPQQRVLVQLPNWSEFVYTYFALQKIGAIVVLLLPRHAQLEINHFCQLTRAVGWIVPEQYRKIDYLPIVEDVGRANPELKHIILVRSESAHDLKTLESLIQDADMSDERRAELLERRPESTMVAHLGPTGGTTGLPKVAPRTHNELICNVEYKVRSWELTNRDICVAVTPAGHDMTFTVAICGSIFSFGTLVLLDSTTPEEFCRVVQAETATCAVMAPALCIRVVNFPGLKDYDLRSLLKVHVGGAPSTQDLIRSVHEKLGCIFVNGLGSTEGLNIMTRLDYDLDTICSTSGRPCCPYSEYRIVDKDGHELPRNTDGELIAKGPDVFAGYCKAAEENRASFTTDGFFRTGDLARMDEFGNIRLTGRIKDVINRGGENINSADIEKLIIEHPYVEDVAVVGMPDKELGERICAYVQPTSRAEVNFEDIILFLKKRGASPLQLPERIEFIDQIPLTKAAKADKAALREDIARKVAED